MSDLSAFHRVDDVAALTISRFVMLADRIAAYGGALAARFRLSPPESAGTASPAGTSTAGVTSAGGGDTPPEVVRQIKLQQFAARHAAMTGRPVDPSSIAWNDNEVLAEMVKMGGGRAG